jgi:hypothetical protein
MKNLSSGHYATDIELPFADIKTVDELQIILVYGFR